MAYGYNEGDYNNAGTTLPDYQNFRNVLFQQWEELNNAVVNLRCSPYTEKKVYLKEVKRCFLRFFSQINDKSKLAHLTLEEREYLRKYYLKPELLNISSSRIILDITRKLMTEYGVFDLESGGSDELW